MNIVLYVKLIACHQGNDDKSIQKCNSICLNDLTYNLARKTAKLVTTVVQSSSTWSFCLYCF